MGREPVALRRDDPVVLALVGAAAEELGHPPRRARRHRLGRLRHLRRGRHPCAQFGPIGDGEHTAGEWVDVASVALVARVLEAAVRGYCA